MISIYSQDNTEYTKNGDAVLIPTRCELSLTINGAWQLTLEHPYDQEERYKYIVEGAVVQCDIKCIRELPVVKQRFRIYTYTKGLHEITAIGFPIAMEATYDAPIDNLVISGKTGAQAMAQIQAFTNKYTLSTDVTKTASASMSNTNVNSAIASGNSNSFVGAWGGEILYSNYDYMVKSRLGDNVAGNHRIIYGRNLTDIEYKKDDSGLTTRIYPISEDGIRLNGTGYVDSPKISDYPIIHHRFMQAPVNLIDTDASSASATAQQTRTSLAAISAAATTLSQGVDISSYPPEYIKQQRADIVAAVQTMALNGVISASLYNAAAKTISDAMAWMNNLAQPEWDWMGSYEAGWKYGNSDGYAVSQYIKIGKTWRYFGANGNWQEPADSSNEWDWHQSTEATGKKYGDFSRYFAHNEYVFITLSGQLKQYWFNEEGWYEEGESGDSKYAWNGTGTAEDPYWFGESSSKYLKSCWAFIDGTYYFFDEYGYYDGSTKFDDYQWDWVDDGSRAWFGNPDHKFAAYYLTNQWCKIDGSWYYFDQDGYVYDTNAARANVISLYTTGMASLATTVSTQATALYTLLYSLMTAYAQSKFNSGVDMPYITITVNMADLSKSTEYAGYENLETVKLGDSVECIDNEHDISMTNRVIGLTYDVIRDYNSEVVLGNAAATVASIVGNANGQAVAGGFDTSAIESQINALQNKVGDIYMNDASIVSNGVGRFAIQPGSNISISRSGNTLTISGEGGGNKVYVGTDVPSASIGAENDLYLQTANYTGDIVGDVKETGGGIVSYSSTRQAYNIFDFEQQLYPNFDWDHISYNLNGLVAGRTYTVAFTQQFTNATFQGGYTDAIYVDALGGTDGTAKLYSDNDSHDFSFSFVAGSENTLIFSYPNCSNQRNITSTITNLTISGTFGNDIVEIYGKIDGRWTKYVGDGTTYEAGANIQIENGVISATDTTYSPFSGATSQTAGSAGLVPAPAINDVDKVLGANGQWVPQTGGSEVKANPSGTATDTLQKIDIDGTIYDLAAGSSNLSDLSDVNISTPTNGQILKYDSNLEKWINATGGGGGSSTLSGLTDVDITSPSNGQALIFDAPNNKWVNGNGGGGTNVVANPSGQETETLIKLQVGNTIYGVSGDGGNGIFSKSVIQSQNITAEFEYKYALLESFVSGVSFTPPLGNHSIGRIGYIPTVDLGSVNESCTIYAVIKSDDGTSSDNTLIGCNYQLSSRNTPNIFTRNGHLWLSVYGSDTDTNVSSLDYHVITLAIDTTTKKARYYIDGVAYGGEKSFNNSGRYVSFGGVWVSNTSIKQSLCQLIYGAVVSGAESESDIVANHALLMTEYASYIGN